MYKLVFDSDALIKLTKSSVIETIIEDHEIHISQTVYTETVIQGKKHLYEDAYTIDRIIKNSRIKTTKAFKNRKANTQLIGCSHLGPGEKTTLHLFHQISADAIVSDDQAFLRILYSKNIPSIIPSDLIAQLTHTRTMDKTQALKALENMRPFIQEANYLKAKNKINKKS